LNDLNHNYKNKQQQTYMFNNLEEEDVFKEYLAKTIDSYILSTFFFLFCSFEYGLRNKLLSNNPNLLEELRFLGKKINQLHFLSFSRYIEAIGIICFILSFILFKNAFLKNKKGNWAYWCSILGLVILVLNYVLTTLSIYDFK